MILFFFVFSFSKEHDVNPYDGRSGTRGEDKIPPNKKCTAKHTIRSKTQLGKCECEPGYPDGDPNLATGCYRCRDECAPHAHCGYPGKCFCNPGYSGDGTKSCTPLAPVFLSVFPEYALAFKPLQANITFETDPKADFKEGFLKIRSKTHKCKVQSKGLLNCTVQNVGKPGTVELYISFDNQTWSKEYVEFQILAPEIGDIASYLFIFLIIAGVIIGVYRTKKRVKKVDPQSIPFLFNGAKEIN